MRYKGGSEVSTNAKVILAGGILGTATAYAATVSYVGLYLAYPGIWIASVVTGVDVSTCSRVPDFWVIAPGNILAYILAALILACWLRFFYFLNTLVPKPGYCSCGYNLTGNESGMCPECGSKTGQRAGSLTKSKSRRPS